MASRKSRQTKLEGKQTKSGERPKRTPSPYNREAILFLDFLGVSDAATTWPSDRASALISLLDVLARSRSSFDMDGSRTPDGGYRLVMKLEVSTFSDHVVASAPYPKSVPQPEALILDAYIKFFQDLVADIALRALDIGLLVRGGLTLGQLYHKDGVVFGEAMIDAHRLESRVAVYPRVIVSSRIYEKLPPEKRTRLLQDADGLWHLDYFSVLGQEAHKKGRNPIADYRLLVESSIGRFEKAQKWNEYAKWAWFKPLFYRALDGLPLGLNPN